MATIGRYEIVRELGKGGMGVVWLGLDPKLERKVAIKSLLPEGLKDATALPRLLREAKAAGQLSHTGIVTIHDVLEDGEMLYIVMEYVEGRTLSDATLNRELCLRVLGQCAAALDHAHGRGVVHRDIKPSNIMLTKHDEAKIADFGIAKRMGSMTDLTGGMAIGTLEYMSPEQLSGKAVDGRADQYSLAVVAYKLLTGGTIFDAADAREWCFAVVHNRPVAASQRNRTLTGAVDAVLERALAKNAGARYKTCAEFVEALRRACAEKVPRQPMDPRVWKVAAAVPVVLFAGWALYKVGGMLLEWNARRPQVQGESPRVKVLPPILQMTVNAKDGLRYVWIAPGTSRMGCSRGDSECYEDEKPAHDVTITKGFWMGQTEVTQGAWKRVMGGNNPSRFKGDDLPVESITWVGAKAYCEAVGMRLPTEAEWEYAARGGVESARYGELDEIAWYDKNSGNKTHRVGEKKANAYRLHDMLGNVYEWVNDYGDAYSADAVSDPKGPASGTRRVVRGGSWYSIPRSVRASYRYRFGPSDRNYFIGVRCTGELIP